MISLGKEQIISLFNQHIRGKEIFTITQNIKHCGKEGHELERLMGITRNSKNEPDLFGYEMKKDSKQITLGDFSASEYIYTKPTKRTNTWIEESISRNEFIQYFGNPNPLKNNRYSWSGKCVPTYYDWNSNGQTLLVSENNDIVIYYSYSKDTRNIKINYPKILKQDNLVIAIWKAEKMMSHINNKFNQKGFFICKKINNKYEKICFGKPFHFDYFIECIKNKKIIFDSGMYQGNTRNYSHFRGTSFWDELITEEY